ncbi:MAG: hypothetical protein ABIH65_01995 [Nanoarchaeota archaeon]
MDYKKLREEFYKKFATGKVKKYEKYSVANEAFPGNFNLSFSEPEMLEKFGGLINIKTDLLYTKIQPCIRFEDFKKLRDKKVDISDNYLGVFDMAGICLCYPNNKEIEKKTEELIKKSWEFLINKLKLDKKKIFVKCFNGGNIKDVSKEKYNINKEIEKDNLTISNWIRLGIPKENIILDKTRATILMLHIYRPTPWGYRNEILYKYNGKLIDIGTIEYLLWEPIFKENKIINIKEWENFCCLAVFGLERLNFIENKLKNIYDIETVNPLFKNILKNSKKKNINEAFLLTEAIRTSQRILTDSGGYEKLSRHRKKKLAIFIQQIGKSLKKLEIPTTKIEDFLNVNANSQPWYYELKRDVPLINKELLMALSRRF